jgi:hypothetical protein
MEATYQYLDATDYIKHDVEDPHHFIMDNINKLKAKQHQPR